MPANFVSGITINELYNPPAEPGPDYNGDGKSDSGDLFIELYNANPTDVNLDGWEIWVNDERQMRFTSDHTIAADGRFVVVSPVAGTAHPIQNVVGPAVYADDWMLFGRTSVISLYDPGANAFFMVAGRWSGSYDLYADAIQAAHPGAEWIGNDPEWGFGKVEFFGDLDNFAGYSFQRVTDGADDLTSIRLANPGAPNCFAPGTMIATPLGEVPVETLRPGDIIKRADGGVTEVRFLLRQTAETAAFGPHAQPVLITQDALGPGLPQRDTIVTAGHALAWDGLLINASALVDGVTVSWVPMAALGDAFIWYHIETNAHEIIRANGLGAESFFDNADRQVFDNHGDYLALYGAERLLAEMDMPRIASRRVLPQRLRLKQAAVRRARGFDYMRRSARRA